MIIKGAQTIAEYREIQKNPPVTPVGFLFTKEIAVLWIAGRLYTVALCLKNRTHSHDHYLPVLRQGFLWSVVCASPTV